MAAKGPVVHQRVHKNTCQNGSKKASTNKKKKVKAYRGQGR